MELGISERLDNKTKFLKGDGFVLEQGYIESASNAQKQSAFNRAFKNSVYVAYSSENVYLNDNTAFIDRMQGKSKYICTIRYNKSDYGIREFADSGIIYCDDSPDLTFPLKISTTTEDHTINYIMLQRNDFFLSNIRYLFERGCFRFKNLKCKEAVLSALRY